MLQKTAILKLKRSLSDVDDLIPMGELTPPSSPSKKMPGSRVNHAFSWTKLTENLKVRKRSSRSSRSSRGSNGGNDYSNPPTDDLSPRSRPTLKPTRVSTSPPSTVSNSLAVQSGSYLRLLNKTRAVGGHVYSISDPTDSSSSRGYCFSYPNRQAPILPIATSSTSIVRSPSEIITQRISYSPFEFDYYLLESPLRKVLFISPKTMERSSRLQLPAMGGTKGRAIQQAKEMEVLVAERAKRSGDEPPPYDFYELIGKGAYGRVFKGYVWHREC